MRLAHAPLQKTTTFVKEKYGTLEDELAAAAAPKTAAYHKYIAAEIESKPRRPDRVAMIFDRAIVENAVDAGLWAWYAAYSDKNIKLPKLVLSIHERAVRNCPWVMALWQGYALASERLDQPHSAIIDVYERALQGGFQQASEFLEIWALRSEYVFRRLGADEPMLDASKTEWRETVDRGVLHLSQHFGPDGDPDARLLQYRARLEAEVMHDMEAARSVYGRVKKSGFGKRADVHLNYLRLERAHGSLDLCRKGFHQALNFVVDGVEDICAAALAFERDRGSLEQYDATFAKAHMQLQRIQKRTEAAQAKEADKGAKGGKKSGGKHADSTKRGSKERDWNDTEASRSAKRRKVAAAAPESNGPKDGGAVDEAEADAAEPSAAVQSGGGGGGGGAAAAGPEPATLDGAQDGGAPGEGEKKEYVADKTTYPRTAFVLNIPFGIEEDEIKAFFQDCGAIEQVRLIKKRNGYAYVQFESEASVPKALALDRKDFKGRPIFVKKCVDKGSADADDGHKFSYANDLEPRKLFVRNISFNATKEDLEQMFSECGAIEDIRMPVKPDGRPKGIAYVEFKEAAAAKKAILVKNEQMLKGRNIVVALSNPPRRGDGGGGGGGGGPPDRNGGGFGGGRGGRGGGGFDRNGGGYSSNVHDTFGSGGGGGGGARQPDNGGGGPSPAQTQSGSATASFRPRPRNQNVGRGGRPKGRGKRAGFSMSRATAAASISEPAPSTEADGGGGAKKSNSFFADLFKKGTQ